MKEVTVFQGHDNYVLALSFSKDGQALASGGMDSQINIWSVSSWEKVKTISGHAQSVNGLDISADGKNLLSGSTDTTLKIWSFPDGELLHTLTDRKKTVASVAFSANGQWAAGAFYGGRAVVWDLKGEVVAAHAVGKMNLGCMAFSPSGALLALGGLGDDISLWSLPGGEHVGTLTGHSVAVPQLRFTKDGKTLVSMGYDQTIRFWDTATWDANRVLQASRPGARGLLLSPDEKQAAVSMEGHVQFWDISEWQLTYDLEVGAKVVSSMAFSPDGDYFVMGGADKKIRVWNTNV